MTRNGANEGEGSVSRFEWVPGPDRGAWVAEQLEGSIGSHYLRSEQGEQGSPPALGWLIPAGFEALVRVLHPFTRDRPVGMSWAEFERRQGEMMSSGEWGELPEIENEPVGWQAAADALGLEVEGSERDPAANPAVLSFRLAGLSGYGEQLDRVAPDGYRYIMPDEGRLEPRSLAALSQVLAEHTATPDRGTVGVWEGWGGLTSANGIAYFGWTQPRPWSVPLERVRQWWFQRTLPFRAHRANYGTRTALRSVLKPGAQHPPGSGVLSKQVSTGPRLELPDRSYICFEAGIVDFAVKPTPEGAPGWAGEAPWVRTDFAMHAQSPNLIWPEAREWFVASEIDFDCTLVACSRDCADALLGAAGIEAVEIDRDTPLWPSG